MFYNFKKEEEEEKESKRKVKKIMKKKVTETFRMLYILNIVIPFFLIEFTFAENTKISAIK